MATGRLDAVPEDNPVGALERLDPRIERNDRWRLPLTFALGAVVLGLAFLRPALAIRAILVALAANLWLAPAVAIAAGLAAVLLPLGVACTAVLGAYLLSLGLDAETVALSPFGPSQSGRFYGVNNLIETLLLVPSFVGAALMGSAGVLVALLALITSAATASEPTAPASSSSPSATPCCWCACAANDGRNGCVRRRIDPDRVPLVVVVDGKRVGDRHRAIVADGENPADANRGPRPPRRSRPLPLRREFASSAVRPGRLRGRAAIGLLVPGAGPTVTREAALAALLRGKLEHDLLGGIAPGENLIQLGAPAGRISSSRCRRPGRSENDTRYPIALLGARGLLTSDSTRIDGLVSVTDVATGRLRVVPNDDPAEALETLDDRIDRNDRLRLPLTIALAALLFVLALVRPQLRCAHSSSRSPPISGSIRRSRSPPVSRCWSSARAACTAILAAYLVSMGLDAETVALSPFGPSQSGRFYGVNNLLETMLLVPSLVGAALLGRAGIGVAALAFVTIGGNRFGADGGGIVVLAAAYLVLLLRLRDAGRLLRGSPRRRSGAVALALLLLGVDAATGGSSHVTDAVGDGPFALAGDSPTESSSRCAARPRASARPSSSSARSRS